MENILNQLIPMFTWFIRISLQASILVCLVLFFQYIFKKKLPPFWLSALWLLVIIKLIIPLNLQSPVSVYNLAPYQAITNINSFSAIFATTSPDSSSTSLLHFLLIIWIVVSFVILFFQMINMFAFARRINRHGIQADKEILSLVNKCKQELKVIRKIKPIIVKGLHAPMVFGFFRIRLLLPENSNMNLSPIALKCIILHELAHIKRHDIFINWLTSLLRAFHWFNPFVWIAFRRLTLSQEVSCDALALSHLDSKEQKVYGQTLIRFIEYFSMPAYLPGMAGILENKTDVKRRISMIAKFKKFPKLITTGGLLLFIGASIFTLTCASLDEKKGLRNKFKVPSLGFVKDFKGDTFNVLYFGHIAGKDVKKLSIDDPLHFITPGFKTVTSKIISKDQRKYPKIRAKLPAGISVETVANERIIIAKKDYITFTNNRKKYINLKNTTQASDLSIIEMRKQITDAKIDTDFSKCWFHIRNMIAIIKTVSTPIQIRSKAHFYLAMLFYREFNRTDFMTRNNLKDRFNQREILFEMVKRYPPNNKWTERACYNLADYYVNVSWRTKNKMFYKYMKLAGRYGKSFFDYGNNILSSMAPDSIIFTEGGDNQVFALQTLMQIAGKRPDITVYDQKGNVFDSIYGDFRKMNQTEVKRIRFKTDKHIIQYKTPPAWTKIRSFVSRKKAFRKRTGYIYFTWKYPRLEKINKAFKKAGLPTWHLERTGMLYVLVKDGEQYTNPENRRNLWKSYKGFKTDKKEALTYPYLAREILVNNHHYYAHWLLDKKLYKQAKVQIEKSTFLGYDMYYLLHNASYIYFEMYKKSVKDLRPQKEHLNNAFKHINRAVNINKKPAVHLIFRSKIHKSSGDLQKAKADLKKAMDLGSKKAEKLLNKMK